MIWRYDSEQQAIYNLLPEMNQDLMVTDFTCAAYTPRLTAPHNCQLVLIGTADGAVTAVNPTSKDSTNMRKLEWLEHGKKEFILGEAISAIIYRYS